MHKKNKHKDIYDYACHICSKQTKLREFLRFHLVKVQSEVELKFVNNCCDTKFFDDFQNNFVPTIEECPKRFWLKNYLDTRIRIVHKKILPHKYNMCEETFP